MALACFFFFTYSSLRSPQGLLELMLQTYFLQAGGWCWGLLNNRVGREQNRVVVCKTHFPKGWLSSEKDAVAQAEVKKQKTGFSAFGHWEPKRNWLLLASTGMEIEKQGLCLICQNTDYIKALCCYLLIPQEIKISRLVGKERKGTWGGAEMFWLWGYPQQSDMITTELFTTKIQIRKCGVGLPGSGLYCGQLSRRDIPPLLFYLFYGKRIKDPH